MSVAAIRFAETDAVNCPWFMNRVSSPTPFHWTIAPEPNPLPFTVSVNAGPFATAVEGFIVVIVGGGWIVKGKEFGEVYVTDTKSRGGVYVTRTWAVPVLAMKALGTTAVN